MWILIFKQIYFDNLPDESKDDVLSFFHNEFWSDIYNHTTDRSGRLNSQVQVLYFLVGIGDFHIDSLWGNGRDFAIHGFIDKLTKFNTKLPEYNSVMHCIKDLIRGDGQQIFDVRVIFEDFIDMVCEGILFRVQDCVDDGFWLIIHNIFYIHQYIR